MILHQTLYHVTMNHNLESIQEQGVDPAFSKGKLRVSWYVDDKQIMWAMAHVSERYTVSVGALSVCVCQVDDRISKRTKWRGVVTVAIPVYPTRYSAAVKFLNDHQKMLAVAQKEYQQMIDEIPF